MDSVAATISGVRFLRTMIISWIWAGLAGGLLASTLYYRKKCRKCEQSLTEQTQNMLDARREIESINRHREELKMTICKYGNLVLHGHTNLTTKKNVDYRENKGMIVVVGRSHEYPTYDFVIKYFPFVANDPSDREFAIREAEELIETIQNF